MVAVMVLDTGLKIAFGWLLLGALAGPYLLFIAPRRRQRRFTTQMRALGWQEQSAEQVLAWSAFEQAAVDGALGQERQTAYKRKIGFLTEHIERQETHSATLKTPVFTFSGTYPRLAVCVTRLEKRVVRSRMILPFFLGRTKKRWTADQLWWGEIRAFPVRETIQVYSWFGSHAGEHFRNMAAKQYIPLAKLREIAQPLREIEESQLLRQVFEHHQRTLDRVRPKIVLTPSAWVLTASLPCAVNHLAAIDTLTVELSKALSTLARELSERYDNG